MEEEEEREEGKMAGKTRKLMEVKESSNVDKTKTIFSFHVPESSSKIFTQPVKIFFH